MDGVSVSSASPLLQSRLDIHDRKQFEVKLEYQPTGEDAKTRYLVEAFFLLPASLNVDPDTYPRQSFYADIHNYVRLKTPVLSLEEMLVADDSPLRTFERRVDQIPTGVPPAQARAYEGKIVYDAKLVSCVFRGALRRFVGKVGEHCDAVCRDPSLLREPVVEDFSRASLRAVIDIRARFREIAARLLSRTQLAETTRASIRLVDEYMSLSVEQFVRKSVADMERLPRTLAMIELRKELMAEVISEETYRKEHKLRSVLSPTGDNEEYMHRMGFLKKFCMNILFLSARRERRRAGGTAEEVLFAVAAGLAMAFATLVAFWGQQRFPQVSLNFFLILVVGYMMKDRIKEGLRRIFASYAAKRLFDRTTTITDPTTKRRIGSCKEKVDYVSHVPDELRQLRRSDDFATVSEGELTETIIRYQKQIVLASEVVPRVAGRMTGVTDIIRFNIERLLRDMDDPEYALEYVDLEDLSVGRIRGAKSYQVDLAFRFSAEDGDQKKTSVQLVRLVLDRNGIKRMARLEPEHPTPPLVTSPVRPAA